MPFVKGQIANPLGRPKQLWKTPKGMSIRGLLEDAFMRNRSAALQKIDEMFTNKDNTDFKFLLALKAGLEPKRVDIEGDGFRALIIQYDKQLKAVDAEVTTVRENDGELQGHPGAVQAV